MKKENLKKSNVKVGKENKVKGSKKSARLEKDALELLNGGEMFGDALICMMSLFAKNFKGMGQAAVGLAKAQAALLQVAKKGGLELNTLIQCELEHFEGEFTDLDFEKL